MNNTQSNKLTIIIIHEKDISGDLDKAIREALVECYPADREFFSRQRAWHSAPEWIVCASSHDNIVAGHIAVIDRTIKIGKDDIPLRIAGLQSVMVRPKWRKSGLSGDLMKTTMDEAKNLGYDFGLLFCLPVLVDKVYANMGWRQINVRVFMKDSSDTTVPLPEKNVAMIYPLNQHVFPEGDIDLQGRDW